MTQGSTLGLRFSGGGSTRRFLLNAFVRPVRKLLFLTLLLLQKINRLLAKVGERYGVYLGNRGFTTIPGQGTDLSRVSVGSAIAYRLVFVPGRIGIFVIQAFAGTVTHMIGRTNSKFLRSMTGLGLIGGEDSAEGQLYHRYHSHLTAVMPMMPYQPKISILMPVYDVDHRFFKEALGSVATQIYPNWELCAVDDCSKDATLYKILESFAAAHPGRVKLGRNERNLHISGTSNNALAMATGDYVTLLDHDDRLYPHSLAEAVRHIVSFDRPEILYSDSGAIDSDGQLAGITFAKPDWSPFMHLAFNYTTHMSVYSTELLRKIGGFRIGFEGSQDYDLMLRAVEATSKPVAHIPLCLYQWRVHEKSTAQGIAAKPYAINAAVKALTEACLRRGRPAVVEFEPVIEHYRIKFPLPTPPPLVSIIIPTKNRVELLAACLKSIFTKTTYPNYEVIVVDNGSDDWSCRELYSALAREHGARFTLIDHPGLFNFGRMNNVAAKEARGEFLLLLNNDTEILNGEWIDEMLRYSQMPEVGAVGAQLLYPTGKIQHAGLVLLDTLIAGSAFERHDSESAFYFNLINTVRETSAVTAACLMVAKQKFFAVAGLDDVALPNGYGDVDFCLKLRRHGLVNVYTPYAKALHFESASRGQCIEAFERQEMMRRWGGLLMNDPYLNPNLKRNQHFEPSEHPNTTLEGTPFLRYLLQSPWFAQAIEAAP